jgi:hypothetical protein
MPELKDLKDFKKALSPGGFVSLLRTTGFLRDERNG